jgi:NAD(P)H dehydrogenase (quinone)
MRVLVIYANPVHDSYQSALHECVVQTLTEAGHDVDDCDLYAENFQPVLTAEERRVYHTVTQNRQFVTSEIERLLSCQALVFVFPIWWHGMPAILKGYIDRVWVPGVAFELVRGWTRPLLQHIVRFAVVTTYGSPWWLNKLLLGDPNRKVLMRAMRGLVSPGARTLWLAQYDMDSISATQRSRFLEKVQRRLREL